MSWQRMAPAPPGPMYRRRAEYTHIETIPESPSFWDFIMGDTYPRMRRPMTLGEFASKLVSYTASIAVLLVISTLVMWSIFSNTVYREHHTPTCLVGAVPDREYAASAQCTLTVHLDTRCDEDIPSGTPTFSEMAARWPHMVSIIAGAAFTALFVVVVVCDVWRQKAWMLVTAWLAFLAFWGVVGTSQYECDDQLRAAHFVLSAALVFLSALYAFLGAIDRSDTEYPARGYIASGWSPLSLWIPFLAIAGVAIALFVTGFQTWMLGMQDNGGGDDYDFWHNALALSEMLYMPLIAGYILIFAWETTDALAVAAAGGAVDNPPSYPPPYPPPPPQHRCVHPCLERPEGRGKRAWRIITAR